MNGSIPGVMLTIDLTSLSTGIHRLELSPSTEQAELDPSTFEDLHVDAVLQYHRDRILVKLHVSSAVAVACSFTRIRSR